MNEPTIYLYDVTYVLADGRILERFGLIAADDISSAVNQLSAKYQNLDSVGIKQLNYISHEVSEEVWFKLADENYFS
jgi:hypothetical protein